MPILSNQRHERFAQELAKGKNASEAYEAAGFKPSRANASILKSKQNILDRVAELQSRVVEGVVLTKEWVIEQLFENARLAREAEDYGPSNKAIELLGKELGMFIDRKEVGRPGEFSRMTDDELIGYISSEIREIGLGHGGTEASNRKEETGGRGRPH